MPSMITPTTLLGFFASVTQVTAHGYVQGIVADGELYTGYLVTQYPYSSSPPASVGWTEDATDLGYVSPSSFASGDIICHKDATNAQLSATVAAGGTVVMEWNTWPESHHGPVIDYLASCNGDCTTVNKTTLEFFKIDEAGLIDDTTSPGTWASDQLIANNNSWSITIPSTIAAGNYVLRHEIIALHGAGSTDGGGSDTPAGTLGEALYTETDPGILVNIYTTGLTYTIPGPALYSSGSAATQTAVAGSSSTSAAVVSSAVVTSSAIPTTFATSVKVEASASSSSAAAGVSQPVATSTPEEEQGGHACSR